MPPEILIITKNKIVLKKILITALINVDPSNTIKIWSDGSATPNIRPDSNGTAEKTRETRKKGRALVHVDFRNSSDSVCVGVQRSLAHIRNIFMVEKQKIHIESITNNEERKILKPCLSGKSPYFRSPHFFQLTKSGAATKIEE